MKAIVCDAIGGLETLRFGDVDEPQAGIGQLRVKVLAAGVNFADTLQIAGRYQIKQEPPFVPGLELAGEVLEAGPGCSRFKAGDRIMANVPCGAYAEQALVEDRLAWAWPEALTAAEAAAFPVIYGTGHAALWGRADIRPGEWLLVLGAAGGVGLAAVELGAGLGARVIACAGGADKVALARDHGAEAGIDYRNEDIKEAAKRITDGAGVNVIFDAVGGDSFDKALRATAPGARVLVIGFASGDVPQIPANYLLVKNISVHGLNWGALVETDPAMFEASRDHLLDMAAQGAIKPPVSEILPLAELPEALRRLKARETTGKLIIEPGSEP